MPWLSRAAARRAFFEWVEGWYEMRRLHSGIGCRGPAVYESVVAA
ncbi:hypothetical protein [Streptomyces sp. NPDC019507]